MDSGYSTNCSSTCSTCSLNEDVLLGVFGRRGSVRSCLSSMAGNITEWISLEAVAPETSSFVAAVGSNLEEEGNR